MPQKNVLLPLDNPGVPLGGHELEYPYSLHSLHKDSTDGESATKCTILSEINTVTNMRLIPKQ